MRRILHFMADIHVSSGMAAVVMNYYRHIDRSRVQFDFLYFEDGPLTYAQEIESLGGRVFLIPRPGPSSMGVIREFFREHQGEFSVLHCGRRSVRPVTSDSGEMVSETTQGSPAA